MRYARGTVLAEVRPHAITASPSCVFLPQSLQAYCKMRVAVPGATVSQMVTSLSSVKLSSWKMCLNIFCSNSLCPLAPCGPLSRSWSHAITQGNKVGSSYSCSAGSELAISSWHLCWYGVMAMPGLWQEWWWDLEDTGVRWGLGGLGFFVMWIGSVPSGFAFSIQSWQGGIVVQSCPCVCETV